MRPNQVGATDAHALEGENMKARMAVAVTVLLVGLVGGWVSAQVFQAPRLVPVQPPIVLSGSDIGFRVEARSGDAQVGTLVVRVDGQWVPAQSPNGGLKLVH
jgi:hypothetical protein